MTMSQLSTSSSPPVTAAPFTAAITGLLAGGHGECDPDGAARSTEVSRLSSLRSTPAQKAGSAPVRMIAWTASSASAAAMASPSRVSSSELIALRAAGRLSMTVATGPSTVYTTTGSAMGTLLEGPVCVRVAVAREAGARVRDLRGHVLRLPAAGRLGHLQGRPAELVVLRRPAERRCGTGREGPGRAGRVC